MVHGKHNDANSVIDSTADRTQGYLSAYVSI